MLQLTNPDHYGEFIDDLAEMHRLRYRIFKERLGWDVQVSGDMEVDEFDACCPVHLLQRNDDGRVQGCVRLLPATGPTMLRDREQTHEPVARKARATEQRSLARRGNAKPSRRPERRMLISRRSTICSRSCGTRRLRQGVVLRRRSSSRPTLSIE